MYDWLSCNNCFSRPVPPETFYITNCGHIFCKKCKDALQDGTVCSYCKVRCTTIELNNDCPAEVKYFFDKPEDMINKAIRVLDFQKTHLSIFQRHLNDEHQKLTKKYSLLKQELIKAQKMVHGLQKMVNGLQKDNMRLRILIKNMLPSQMCPPRSASIGPPACLDESTISCQGKGNSANDSLNSSFGTDILANTSSTLRKQQWLMEQQRKKAQQQQMMGNRQQMPSGVGGIYRQNKISDSNYSSSHLSASSQSAYETPVNYCSGGNSSRNPTPYMNLTGLTINSSGRPVPNQQIHMKRR